MSAAIISALISTLGPALLKMGQGGGKEGRWDSTYSPQQQQAQGQMLNGLNYGAQDITQNQNYQTGQDYLQGIFNDPDFFNKFEAPLQRKFSEETIPGLANQFAGMGTGGSFGSGFENAAAREGRNLNTDIAALRGGMQQQAVPQLLGYAQQPTANFMNQYGQATGNGMNNVYRPATAGGLGEVGGSLTGASSGGWADMISQIMGGLKGNNQPAAPASVGLSRQYPGQ